VNALSRVASTRHTVLLVLALLAMSVQAARDRPMAQWPRTLSEPGARSLLYVWILGLQWVWAGYVWFGLRRAGTSLRTLIDEGPWTPTRWLRYAAVGFAGFIFWMVFQAGLGSILRPSPEQLRGVAAMLPHTAGERLLWVAFALCAGILEEIVYRGYLMRQFGVLTGNLPLALLLQAALYGCGHLALPLEMVVSVALLGVLLGAIAVWQKSLVPGMILHTGTGLMAIVGSLTLPATT
jgi:membrane protease YdiL (CAAX protease family)